MKAKQNTNICFVSYREPFEVVLDNFSKAISLQTNYNITLVANGDVEIACQNKINKRKVHIIRLPTKINSKLRKFLFAIKTAKYLKDNKFTIIHIDISCRYIGLIKILSQSKASFIYHILSYPVTSSNISRIKNMLTIYLQSIFLDKVIIQSKEIKERWIGLKHLKKSVIIPVGFDKNLFYPIEYDVKRNIKNKLSIPNDHTLLIYSGVISKQRNLEILISSMSLIYNSNQNVKLLFLGGGNSISSLKNYAKSIGIDHTLIFLGQVSHNSVVNYLGAADIAISYVPVNESYNYNPPLKTFEYLASGLPTVATNTVSNKNIIVEGVNGILVEDTPESIASGILELISNVNMQESLRLQSRESIHEYDYSNLTSQYLIPLYEELLQK